MIRAAILTYRPKATNRLRLLRSTFLSLIDEADAVWVVDNGSGPDEVDAITDTLGLPPWTHSGDLHTCGYGTNLQARILAGADCAPDDICVLSDDDMIWRPGWADQLAAWWAAAPADVVLTGCHLEPAYPWNTIAGAVTHGGVDGLVRASTGAASWSYRAMSHDRIFPIPQRHNGTGDVPACQRIIDGGGTICQLDIAEHVGLESTWGNRTVEMHGWDVDPVRRLMREAVAS